MPQSQDLAYATGNVAVQSVYGSYGSALAWGCYDHGSYGCWKVIGSYWFKYWSYGNHCYGEHVQYGPSRYNSISHNYPYIAKAKSCNGDTSPW